MHVSLVVQGNAAALLDRSLVVEPLYLSFRNGDESAKRKREKRVSIPQKKTDDILSYLHSNSTVPPICAVLV